MTVVAERATFVLPSLNSLFFVEDDYTLRSQRVVVSPLNPRNRIESKTGKRRSDTRTETHLSPRMASRHLGINRTVYYPEPPHWSNLYPRPQIKTYGLRCPGPFCFARIIATGHGPTTTVSLARPKLALDGSIASTSNSAGPVLSSTTCPAKVLLCPAYERGTSLRTWPSRSARATTRIFFASQSPPGSVGHPQVIVTVARTSTGERTDTRASAAGDRRSTVNPWISKMIPSPSTSWPGTKSKVFDTR